MKASVRVSALLFLFSVFMFMGERSNAATGFHVSPEGSRNGDGSSARPWDLQTALNQPSAVQPGDTIWLHGGVYAGYFRSNLVGTAAQPIIVRQAPRERVTIDGGDSQGKTIFTIAGAYTWFWGFEVTSTNLHKISSQSGSWPTDLGTGECIGTEQSGTNGTGCKLINLAVHDGKQGLSLWIQASDFEAYGCIVYYNGWMGSDGVHGHGIYAQNETGAKLLTDNIVFDNFSEGIQIYGSSTAPLNNFDLTGNVVFGHTDERNILLGGSAPVQNPVVRENFVYDKIDAVSADIGWNSGYGAGVENAVIENNYFVGRFQLWHVNMETMAGNLIYGSVEGFSPGDYPANTYTASRPSSNTVTVRPNKYEPGRANIVVYNWNGVSTVEADLSGVLSPGDEFAIVDAQNYFGEPVVSGTYTGDPVPLPMGETAMSRLVGDDPRDVSHTGDQFAAFVVTRSGSTPTAVQAPPAAPLRFSLAQNYPNPFNPSTRIRFSVPAAEHVSLSVYNVIGQEVARLVDRRMEAGTHEVTFPAGDLPSGMYFYELRAGADKTVRRMVLTK